MTIKTVELNLPQQVHFPVNFITQVFFFAFKTFSSLQMKLLPFIRLLKNEQIWKWVGTGEMAKNFTLANASELLLE